MYAHVVQKAGTFPPFLTENIISIYRAFMIICRYFRLTLDPTKGYKFIISVDLQHVYMVTC
jgi:hypothetical protein